VRLQFSTEINVRLSQRSLPRWERFGDEMGVDVGLHQVGYLILITSERDVAPFERSLAMWSRLGVPAQRLDQRGVREIFPELRVDDLRFATFCAKDGYLDPTSMLNGYVARARSLGVRFREGEPVTAIDRGSAGISGVRTPKGAIATETVVNAAGPWAAQVAALCGVDLPITPLRRQVFVTDPVRGLEHDFPLTVEMATSFYFHRESGGVLMGMADPADKPGFDDSVNWDFLPTIVERGLERLPLLERANVKTGWAGFYEDTPDKHPILGRIAGVPGFICVAGFSGHGLMHAPAAGEAIAELIVDGKTTLDISALSHDRFARGKLIREHNVI
jgi:sarcosine oxidase subunit beta